MRQFPAHYAGDYFYGDYCSDYIKRIDPSPPPSTTFATALVGPSDVQIDSEGDLYYLARPATGRVYKVRKSTPDRTPLSSPGTRLTRPFDGSTVTFSRRGERKARPHYQWQKNGSQHRRSYSPTYSTPTLVLHGTTETSIGAS